MEEKVRFGIFARLWLVMMIIALAPVGLLGYASYQQGVGFISRSIDDSLGKVSSAIVNYTELWVDNIAASLTQGAVQPDMVAGDAKAKEKADLSKPAGKDDKKPEAKAADKDDKKVEKKAEEPKKADAKDDKKAADKAADKDDKKGESKDPTPIAGDPRKSILESIVASHDYLRATYFMRGSDGWQTVRSDDTKLLMVGDRPYFRDAMRGQTGIQVIISRTTKLPALIVAVPVKGKDQSIIGGLATASELTMISAQIANAKFGKTGYAFMLDRDGKVAAHPNSEYTTEQKDLSEHPAYVALRRGDKMPVMFNDQGKDVVAYAGQTKHGWTIIAQQDKEEAYASLQATTDAAERFLAVAAFLVTLMSLIVSRWFTRPIQNLTSVADQISRGEVGARIDETSRSDEIGALARAIDRLQTSVRLALDRLKKA